MYYVTHYLAGVGPCEENIRLVCTQTNILKCHAIQCGDLTIPDRERGLEVSHNAGTCSIVVGLALAGREEHIVWDLSPGVNASVTSRHNDYLVMTVCVCVCVCVCVHMGYVCVYVCVCVGVRGCVHMYVYRGERKGGRKGWREGGREGRWGAWRSRKRKERGSERAKERGKEREKVLRQSFFLLQASLSY